MRIACVVIFAFIAASGLAAAQTSGPSTEPSTPPSKSRPSGSGGVGVSINLGSLFGSRENPCDRKRKELEDLTAKVAKNNCEKEEAEVEQAKANLAKVKSDIDAERARRDALAADARAAEARKEEADAKLAAAQAAAARADEAVDDARNNLRQFLQNYWGDGPEWFPLEAPAEPGWIPIEVEDGITVYMQDGDYWTPERLAAAKSRLRQVLASSAAGRAARNALRQALANQAAAQQALDQAQANANAAAQAAAAAAQATQGLPPIDAKLKPAEKRLDRALAALEKCRKKQSDRLTQIAQLEEELRECDRLEALARRLETATEAGEDRIEKVQEEIDNLKDQLKDLEKSAHSRPKGADEQTRAAQEAAKAKAKEIRDQIKAMEDDMEAWRKFAKNTADGDPGVEGLTTEGAVGVVEDGAERFEDYLQRVYKLFSKLRGAERDWASARARAEGKADAEDRAQKDWEEGQEDFAGLAKGMAQDTAKSALGEVSEGLNILFAMAAAIDHISEMRDDQRALLRSFGQFLGGVLSAQGDIKLCYAYGEQFAIEVAKLTNSDTIVGGTAMLHLGMQYCEVFMASARDPEMRKIMQKVHNAAMRA